MHQYIFLLLHGFESTPPAKDKNKLLDISEVTMSHIKRHWPDFADYAVDLEHLNALFTHLDDNNDRMLNATELRKYVSFCTLRPFVVLASSKMHMTYHFLLPAFLLNEKH